MSLPILIAALTLMCAQLVLPRRLAFLPLLVAACHTGAATVVSDFNVIRLVIIVGILRAAFAGHLPWSFRNPLDLLMAAWVAVALLSAVGHESARSNPFIYRAGLVFNVLGTYLYARAYLQEPAAIPIFSKSLVVVLVFLSVFLAVEQRTSRNQYGSLGSPKEESSVREGRVRAQGPFGTPILAGTVGASSLPIVVALRNHSPGWMRVGVVACLLITACSGSTGPVSTLIVGIGAVLFWRWRDRIRALRLGVVCGIFFLALLMERPVWYLMAKVDFVGGSTGWHRARLIDAAVRHFNEWWLAGADYTRHWMPYGLPAVPEHCDLTNYYIHLGVIGGLSLVLVLLGVLIKTFQMLGRRMAEMRREGNPDEFGLWCVTSALVAHSVTFLSVSYFDNMFVLFWILIGAVPGFIGRTVALRLANDIVEVREKDAQAHLAWYPA